MFKKKILIVIIIIITIFVSVYAVSVGFINLDYVGKGKLNSITIHDYACITSICEEEDWETTISNPEQLKSLESAFFNKIQDINHHTKEDGPLSFIFHYDHKDIEFHLSINREFDKGTIYYINRQITYNFANTDMKILQEIFTIK